MSWSQSAKGSAAEVKEQAKGFAAAVRRVDEGWGASDEVKDEHEKQATIAADVIGRVIAQENEGETFTVTANGHASSARNGTVGVSYNLNAAT